MPPTTILKGQRCPGGVSRVPVREGSAEDIVAEAYFFERLRSHYKPLGYHCFTQYDYAGTVSTVVKNTQDGIRRSNSDPQVDAILEMLWEKFPYKPDFLAICGSGGVIAEVGTVDQRRDKINQVRRNLELLRSISQFGYFPQMPIRWEAAAFRPSEGPVMIPMPASSRSICTAPTWRQYSWREEKYKPSGISQRTSRGIRDVPEGVLLYEVHQARRHRQTEPMRVPVLPPAVEKDFREAVRGLPMSPGFADERARRLLEASEAMRNAIRTEVILYGAAAVAAGLVAIALTVATPGLPDELLLASFASSLAAHAR